MWFKVAPVFVAILAVSFGTWFRLAHAGSADAESKNHAITQPSDHLNNDFPFYFDAVYLDEKRRFLHAIRQKQLTAFLKHFPQSHLDSVKKIILNYNPTAHRGLGGNGNIMLRAVHISTQEMLAVATHELAHNIFDNFESKNKTKKSNFRHRKKILYEGNPVVDFCYISWHSEDKRKSNITDSDFVSGYAGINCFEDFAESYTYYLLHHNDFKIKASSSAALRAKYLFIKNRVSGGQNFDTGHKNPEKNGVFWDVTVLRFDVRRFLVDNILKI